MKHINFLTAIAEHSKAQPRPLAPLIDQEGLYPEQYLKELGKLGGFAAVGNQEDGGLGYGLGAQIQVIQQVGKECGATAFSV